jgi:mono/diheme cytochrome c family protein
MGGSGPDQKEEGKEAWVSSAMAWVLGAAAGVVILAAMGIAYEIGYNRGSDDGGEPPARTAAAEAPAAPAPPPGPGRELFAASCGSCHTLSEAGTTGTTGPNLDDLQPGEEQVTAAIQNGGTGSGLMPANLLQGQEAADVAAYVSASAGG